MRRPSRETLLIFTMIGLLAGSIHAMTVAHEHRHAAIFRDYGCENIEIEYEYFDFDDILASTWADCEKRPDSMDEAHDRVHEVQTVFNYSLLAILVIFDIVMVYDEWR